MFENNAGRPSGHEYAHNGKSTGPFNLSHSTIIVEYGPAGPVARIEHNKSNRPNPEYAGPLTAETIAALTEVSA